MARNGLPGLSGSASFGPQTHTDPDFRSSTLGRPLITGAYSKDPKADEKQDTSTYNALFLVDQLGNNLDKPYRKTELLAFGEYLPLSEQFPFLLKLLPFVSNFGRGHGPEVMKWETPQGVIKWGGQICYEGLYPSFTRGLAEKGADILVNVTNDSWFGKNL
ncbi:nitrilase-related carbon-nitrogen hydrolase [Bdellovibrio bacteriovorus]|uniref:nitrilase-related carbon-nitrogen hydrolase n=1 Tax=Bdellovibrio bacteriovorus TaxID=959 RepID=UPI0035A58B8B